MCSRAWPPVRGGGEDSATSPTGPRFRDTGPTSARGDRAESGLFGTGRESSAEQARAEEESTGRARWEWDVRRSDEDRDGVRSDEPDPRFDGSAGRRTELSGPLDLSGPPGPAHPLRFGASGLLGLAVEEIDRAKRLGFDLVTPSDVTYPTLLLEIPDPPPVLYIYGCLEPDDEVRVAFVGSRLSSRYGNHAAHELAAGLAEAGVTIVSGMARGIDAAAHEAALSRGTRTIAVLGSGLARLYPPEHHDLARKIAKSGAVISEYPLEWGPLPGFFPRRNRVISGLCCGVVVVEAAKRSGALVTARLTLEQNRELFSVPGPIFTNTSLGTNALLAEGVAHAALSPESILDQLPPPFRARLGLPVAGSGRPASSSTSEDGGAEASDGGPASSTSEARNPETNDPPLGSSRSRSRRARRAGAGEGAGELEAANRPVNPRDLPNPKIALTGSEDGQRRRRTPTAGPRNDQGSPRPSAKGTEPAGFGDRRGGGGAERGERPRAPAHGSDEERVLACLSIDEPIAIDDLAEECGLSAPRLLSALCVLEMSGLADRLPGSRVARIPPSGRRT